MGLTLLLIAIIPPAFSFSSGAPQAACQSLAPNATLHNAQPQVTDIPYVLNLSAFYDQATGEMVYTPDTVYNSKIIVSMLTTANYIYKDKNCAIVSFSRLELRAENLHTCLQFMHVPTPPSPPSSPNPSRCDTILSS